MRVLTGKKQAVPIKAWVDGVELDHKESSLMTICCNCGRHFWPGRNECPGSTKSDGCNHKPCKYCRRYVDEKEKSYERKSTSG